MPRGPTHPRASSHPTPSQHVWHRTLEDALRLPHEEGEQYEYKVINLRRLTQVGQERPPGSCLSGLFCGQNNRGRRAQREDRMPEEEEVVEVVEEEEEEEENKVEEVEVERIIGCQFDCHRLPPARPPPLPPPILRRRPEPVTLDNLSDAIGAMLRPVDTFCGDRLRRLNSQTSVVAVRSRFEPSF